MKPREAGERRHFKRYPFGAELRAEVLAYLGLRSGPVIRGRAQDISQGGLSILTRRRIPVSSLVRCEIRLTEVPVALSLLSRVQWILRNPADQGYLVGLQFLL